MGQPKTQREKFEEAARELECDDDANRFDERMMKLVERNGGEEAD